MSPVFAPSLRPGDRVAVLAPSSSVFTRSLDAGVGRLREWGFDVIEGAHLRDRHGHLGGLDADRLGDLRTALADPSVAAVFAGRGGYGVQRLVDRIDWSEVRQQPTLIVGFSDLTALLHAAWQRAALVGIHGPSAGRLGAMSAAAAGRLRSLLLGEPPPPIRFEQHQVVTAGEARGALVGGNLSMICSNIGTRDELELDGELLLLEDVNEAPYALDRMLTQLGRCGMLAGAAGVVIGGWVGCEAPSGRPSATAAEVTAERLGSLGVPVVVGLPVGHVEEHLAVGHGVDAELDTGSGELRTGAAAT